MVTEKQTVDEILYSEKMEIGQYIYKRGDRLHYYYHKDKVCSIDDRERPYKVHRSIGDIYLKYKEFDTLDECTTCVIQWFETDDVTLLGMLESSDF